MKIWNPINQSQNNIITLFKDIFIEQRKQEISSIFIEDFGLHNGHTKESYVEYEMDEFALKCEKFGLQKDCQINSFNIGNGFIYFSLGKKEDRAIFEAIFKWNEKEQKLQGNNYAFKIEPKMQFIKENGVIYHKRRINLTAPLETLESLTPLQKEHKTLDPLLNSATILNTARSENHTIENKIKRVLIHAESDNFDFIRNELPAHLGGNFYSLVYDLSQEENQTFWDEIQIFSQKGIYQYPVLMRGEDHPLFIKDLFPEVNDYEITYKKNIFPVVLYILFEDDEEQFFKYPQQNYFKFDKKIKKVCLTDPLSFDWIIHLKD